MSFGKLNRPALDETFCYWYYKVYRKFPDRSCVYTRANTIKLIWTLKRKYARIARQEEVESFN